MKHLIILILCFVLFSCESRKGVFKDVSEENQYKYKQTDVESVKESYEGLVANKKKRKIVYDRGVERAKKFKGLFLKLHDFKQGNYELKLSDLIDIDEELLDVSNITINSDTNNFSKMNAQDDMRIDRLYKEASKGINNNKAYEQLKERYAELQKKNDEQITKETIKIGKQFMWFGGGLFAFSCFTSFSFVAGISNKLKMTGITFLFIGCVVMLFGTFIDWFRDFLNNYGDKVMWITLLPLIGVLYIKFGVKADKAIDEIKDNDNNDWNLN